MIYVKNRRSSLNKLSAQFPRAVIFDLTSKSADPQLAALSPFYPHGGIPIPFSPGATACSVEGIWQGLKVFQYAGIDQSSFSNSSMRNLKRTVRVNGLPRGHQKGLYSRELLDYRTARELIYLPVYKWVLDHVPAVQPALNRLRQTLLHWDVILLDYNINCDYLDLSRPLSHAGLVKLYLENNYPQPWQASGEVPLPAEGAAPAAVAAVMPAAPAAVEAAPAPAAAPSSVSAPAPAAATSEAAVPSAASSTPEAAAATSEAKAADQTAARAADPAPAARAAKAAGSPAATPGAKPGKRGRKGKKEPYCLDLFEDILPQNEGGETG